MNEESSLNVKIVQCVQSMESRDGPGKMGISSSKPDKLANSQFVYQNAKSM